MCRHPKSIEGIFFPCKLIVRHPLLGAVLLLHTLLQNTRIHAYSTRNYDGSAYGWSAWKRSHAETQLPCFVLLRSSRSTLGRALQKLSLADRANFPTHTTWFILSLVRCPGQQSLDSRVRLSLRALRNMDLSSFPSFTHFEKWDQCSIQRVPNIMIYSPQKMFISIVMYITAAN